jgi:hypothetical protein
MRRVGKSMVEVLKLRKETRDQWMQHVKGKEYPTTRMDDYFGVGESQPRAPKEKAASNTGEGIEQQYQAHGDGVQETTKWRAKRRRRRDGGE